MNSLELFVRNKTASGAVHLEVKSSGDELGILYLTLDQYEKFLQIIRTGCFNKDVDFRVEDPYNSEEEGEDDTYNNFFTID